MGVDLKLLVMDLENVSACHSMLETDRDYALQQRVKEIAAVPLARSVYCYVSSVPDGSMKGEPCYGEVSEDAYGDVLRYVSAGELSWKIGGDDYLSPFNNAIHAYLKALPPTTKIVLYWH